MNIWRSLEGILEVEMTSAQLEGALAAINNAGIEVTNLRYISELTCHFDIRRNDYVHIQKILNKRCETVKLIHTKGIYWTLKSVKSRPVLLCGILILFAVILFLPSRVFFMEIVGNTTVPTNQILEAAEVSGICFGASRREVRSEKVKNALLSAIPQLQWAGVNTLGCTATVSVRERIVTDIETEEKTVSNIIASQDGYILSGTVTQGNGIFEVGQTVKAGQILISGYTDCGICIRATRSEGEIMAQTNRKMEAVMVSNYVHRGSFQDTKQKMSVLVGKKRINLWKDSGISDSRCGRMYKEYYITLPGGFRLPIAFCLETFDFHKTQTGINTQTEAEASLKDFAADYMMGQMVAGEIKDKNEIVTLEDEIYRLTGEYTCIEMIGREQREQIGDTNG